MFTQALEENNFILFDCSTRKNKVFYIGRIQLKLENELKFL